MHSDPTSLVIAPPPTPGFWQRRVVRPLLALITMGITPDRIAATLAVGTVCSLFPILGTTWLLNLAIGLRLRMNQPIMQTLNQLLTPVHLVMILVYVRIGEWVWMSGADRFTVAEMVATFRHATWMQFFERFGWAGVHALSGWLVTSPVLLAGLYVVLRPLMKRFAWKRVPAPVP